MGFRASLNTIFAIVIPELQFSYPSAGVLIAVSAVAWILLAIEVRRTIKGAPASPPASAVTPTNERLELYADHQTPAA
jgi:hypothetical protein